MRIGEFSRETGLPVTALRYYDQLGLIKPRRQGDYREYGEKDLKRARVIIFLQKMNFNLSEIKELLQLDQLMEEYEQGRVPRELIVRGATILEGKNRELKEKMESLKEAISYVEHLIDKIQSLEDG